MILIWDGGGGSVGILLVPSPRLISRSGWAGTRLGPVIRREWRWGVASSASPCRFPVCFSFCRSSLFKWRSFSWIVHLARMNNPLLPLQMTCFKGGTCFNAEVNCVARLRTSQQRSNRSRPFKLHCVFWCLIWAREEMAQKRFHRSRGYTETSEIVNNLMFYVTWLSVSFANTTCAVCSFAFAHAQTTRRDSSY